MEHAVTTVALQKERYLISILRLIDCLRVALVAEKYGENGIDIEVIRQIRPKIHL